MARARAMARTRQWVHCSGVIAVGARAKTRARARAVARGRGRAVARPRAVAIGLGLWLELWLGLWLTLGLELGQISGGTAVGGTALGAMQWGARVKSWAGLKSYNWQTVAWFENQSTIMLAYMCDMGTLCFIDCHLVAPQSTKLCSMHVVLCPLKMLLWSHHWHHPPHQAWLSS